MRRWKHIIVLYNGFINEIEYSFLRSGVIWDFKLRSGIFFDLLFILYFFKDVVVFLPTDSLQLIKYRKNFANRCCFPKTHNLPPPILAGVA